MKLAYSVVKKFGTQTDRTAYSFLGFEVEYFPNVNKYQFN